MYYIDHSGICKRNGINIEIVIKRQGGSSISSWLKMGNDAVQLLNSGLDINPQDIVFKYDTALLLVKPTAPLYHSTMVQEVARKKNSFAINPFTRQFTIVTKTDIEKTKTLVNEEITCQFKFFDITSEANISVQVSLRTANEFAMQLSAITTNILYGILKFSNSPDFIVYNNSLPEFMSKAFAAYSKLKL